MSRRALLLSPLVFLFAFTVDIPLASPAGASLGANSIFLEAPVYGSGGYQARSAAVADVNGDGKLDLLVTNYCATSDCANSTGAVGVALGNGDGSFQATVTYSSGGWGASSIAVADVNGDGKPDLLVAHQCDTAPSCSNSVFTVLLGNGDGTFQVPQGYTSGGWYPTAIAVADVNRDGKPDVVIANQCPASGTCDSSIIAVLLGIGDGSFHPAVVYTSGGANANSVAVADLNGDGKPDVIVANENTAANNTIGIVGVLLGNGDGSFQSVVAYGSGGSFAASVAVADVNADGRPDLVLANFCVAGASICGGASAGAVGVLLGNGNGTFQTAVSYESGGEGAYSIAAADVNGDGRPDLLVANECAIAGCGDGTVAALLGRGDGSFLPPTTTYDSGGSRALSLLVNDVNGDGKPDLLVVNQCVGGCANGAVGVLLGNGDGTFRGATTYTSAGWANVSLALADVNGDGKPDLLVANECPTSDCTNTNGSVGVLLGNGDGTFQTAATYASGGFEAVSVAVSDLNGDGKLDLLVANSCATNDCTTGLVSVLLGNGDGTFQSAVSYNSGGTYAESIAVTDVNSDGKPDVLVSHYYAYGAAPGPNLVGAVGVLLGNGDGTFQPAISYGSGGLGTVSMAVADVNRDGKPDVLVANLYGGSDYSNGKVGVLLGKGDGTFQSATSYPAGGQFAKSVAVGDVNGDGVPDLLVGNQCNYGVTNCDNLVVLFGNGDGTFRPIMNIAAPAADYSSLALGDFNGDGRLDVVSASGGLLLLGAGNGIFDQPILLGTSGPSLAIGDFNLDGKPDLAVGGVTILLNVSPAPVRTATTTTLTSSPNPSAYGQSVSFRASVSVQSGSSPTGTVTFSDGGSMLGTVSFVNGSASLSVSTFAIGSHSISASYSGDSSFSQSSSALTQTVNPVRTTTAAAVSPNPSVFGQSVAITATVTSGAGVPSGSVTFNDGSTGLATGSLNGSGQAAFSTSALTAGTHTITGSYGGAGNFAGSTSNAVSLTVNKASTITSISTQTPNPSVAGQPISISFTVNPVPPGSGARTGNVSVSDGSGHECSAAVAASACSIAIPAAGTKTLKATYGGDNNFNLSASAGITHNVTDFSIISSPTSQTLKAAQKVTYKLTLAPLNGFAGTVSLSCAGLPANSTCSFNPASVRLSGSSSATSTVTVQTSKTTQKGMYTLSLVGTYGTGSPQTGGLTHSVKVTLAVQ
jgi:hypothetical protein